MHLSRRRRVLEGAASLPSRVIALRASNSVSHLFRYDIGAVQRDGILETGAEDRITTGDTARDNGANLVRQSILALNVTNVLHPAIALQDAAIATCSVKIASGTGPTPDDAMAPRVVHRTTYIDA